MYFSFSDEQTQFRDAVRRFLSDKSSTGDVRRSMATEAGFDRAVVHEANAELGLAGIHIPERYGGLGFGYVELCIALEEMGRALFCAPYFSTAVLAANALMNCADEASKRKLLPRIASGGEIACLAITEANGRWEAAASETTAIPDGDRYLLNGTKRFVIDGAAADLIIVVARIAGTSGEDGLSLFAVEGEVDGLERRSLAVIDPTRRQAELTFSNVRGELISELGTAGVPIGLALAQSSIALANEMVGGCQVLMDSAVEYAKLRMQFGRPIGSFQAIKHKCADMLLDVELAKSAAYYAAAAVADKNDDVLALAALAKATVSDAYMRTAAECIQIHGGIGFTWDQDTHLWFKRAKSSEVLLGTSADHRERYMQLMEHAE